MYSIADDRTDRSHVVIDGQGTGWILKFDILSYIPKVSHTSIEGLHTNWPSSPPLPNSIMDRAQWGRVHGQLSLSDSYSTATNHKGLACEPNLGQPCPFPNGPKATSTIAMPSLLVLCNFVLLESSRSSQPFQSLRRILNSSIPQVITMCGLGETGGRSSSLEGSSLAVAPV